MLHLPAERDVLPFECGDLVETHLVDLGDVLRVGGLEVELDRVAEVLREGQAGA